MTDDRPRPQYGEYAPPGWVSPVAAPEPETVMAAPPPAGTPSAAPTRRTWDVAVTLALLGFGLYSVVSGFVAFTDAPALFRQVFAMLDIGTFTSDEAARTAGVVIMIVQAAIWIVVAWYGVRALRRGKLAFVWPLVGGVVANVIVAVIAGVVMAGDPAYVEYLGQLTP